MGRPLPRSFFERDADVVARELLGHLLVHETPEGRLGARVIETEAYFGPAGRNEHLRERDDMPASLRRKLLREGDPASHSFPGVTKRNTVMYGPPGVWYVYLIYGMHECVNVVTGPKGGSGGRSPERVETTHEPQAVLLRAAEPVEGADIMRSRQGGRLDLGGPARLCKALGITRALYGADATKGALRFERGEPIADVEVTTRINVVGGEDLPLRFVARKPRSRNAKEHEGTSCRLRGPS